MARERRPAAQPLSAEEIADELYSLTPQTFIGRRDEFVRELKDAGDQPSAKAVGSLRKPSTSAWLANQLVRAHRDEVTALLDLGGALRQAQSRLEGAQLRELSRQRRQAVNALVRQARQLAVELGHPVGADVGRELEQTLEAALSSREAADAFESGRLTATLAPSDGFAAATPHLRAVPDVGRDASQQPAKQEPKQEPKEHADRARAARAAQARLARAKAAALAAARDLAECTAAHDELTARLDDLEGRISALKSELSKLEGETAETKRDEQRARKAVAQSQRAARQADLSVEAAEAAEADLRGT